MSDRPLRLLLVERERAAIGAASTLERSERELVERRSAFELAKLALREATEALEELTRAIVEAKLTTAREIERSASRRASARTRVDDARANLSCCERALHTAETARNEARQGLADAIEARRVVAEAIELRERDARRASGARDDEEADELTATMGAREP